MSQMRVLFGELRAGFSAATVCALILGLLFANFAEAAAATTPRIVAKTGGYALCVEHLKHSADAQTAPSTGDRRTNHKCPGCCLVAALGAALPPERVTHTTRPADLAIVVAYAAAPPRQPPSLMLRAANGARAPPV